MSKYKYYFRKPRSEIGKDILKYLFISGGIYLSASSPYFVRNIKKEIKRWRKYKEKQISNIFYNFQKKGYINIEQKGKQVYMYLTKEGKKKANWLQIDELKIKRPKKWDKKWRVVIFDISESNKFRREVFRGKIKELGFYELQKSVWINPFDCLDEINLLKTFLNFSDREVRVIIADNIGGEESLREKFKI